MKTKQDNCSQIVDAAQNGNLEVCKRLLEDGADIHIGSDRPFRWAAQNGHLEVCKWLLKHGADVHAINDYALRWAAEYNHLEVCELLIEHGANLKVLFAENGNPTKIVYECATKEQIRQAKKEFVVWKVMDL